jgi:hypothetical protein
MDKSRKKEILNEYKKRELEKLSQSGDKISAVFAKSKLGLKSEELSLERLKNIEDDRLIEIITEKINEVIEATYKTDPKRYRNADNVIPELNESLRAIHFTNIFEMYVAMGDIEKFLDGAAHYEVAELIKGYRLLKLDNVSDKISIRKLQEIEDELSDDNRIQNIKIEYIRTHLNQFELS